MRRSSESDYDSGMRLSEARDAMVWVSAYMGTERLSWKSAIDRLRLVESTIDRQVRRSRKPEKRDWFVMARQEIRDAIEAVARKDKEAAFKLIEEAQWHLNDARSRRPTAPRFVVGPEGTVEDLRPNDDYRPRVDEDDDDKEY